ncbi:C-type lectin domain family 6 member A-like [Puntigrus tetrazona]|uniref:C-type lectin domain family 6 member A-like n=1 Tax=Puntigrus tetrazona TaxID=1606681 RepID=UPI001C89A36B|nr:C-type lectin domain family 6 member A-like [Puntigrus tetrazona]
MQEDFYDNATCKSVTNTTRPQTYGNDRRKARNHRRRRCLVPITVCLGILCLLLIAVITLQHFQAATKQGYLWGPDGLFMSNEEKSWSDSRQYCRDRGADLVIINTEEKQRHISSFVKDKVWIGLSDKENESNMKWVDNSPMNRGFWAPGEPNNYQSRREDCIELNPSKQILENWNDLLCSEKRKAICEK